MNKGTFVIHYDTYYKLHPVDITKTLARMSQDDLFRIVRDMGIDIPMVIPAFPMLTRKLYELDVSSCRRYI